MAELLWILGAGGHAKVVIATARAAGVTELAVADDDPARHGESLLGVMVQARVSDVLADASRRAVIAIGNNEIRHRLGTGARCRFESLVHPSAIVDPSVTIGPGSVVFAGAIVQPDSVLGAHTIVNTAASIDHDCVLGTAIHVAPGSRLAGNVRLDDGVFVGIGAVITPGRHVGAWTTIGAGAVVVRDLPARVTAIGVPARPRI